MNTDDLLFFYRGWLNNLTPNELRIAFERLLLKNGFEIFNFVEHHFVPHGYTCLWLLGESHLAIHTFPENDKTFFELCSCSEPKLILFKDCCEKLFILTP